MALNRLSDPFAVRAALDEFDRIGRSAFLDKYGFKEARDYFVVVGERRYDSKAVAGAAHGYQFPSAGPLRAKAFSGGALTVARKLESMGFQVTRPATVRGALPRESDLLARTEAEAEAQVEASGAFDPSSIEDARKKTFAAIVTRQGQPAFRRALLNAYEHRCALTGCDVPQVLEAAHICGYMGPETNDVRNGLLLRADLHTLYDRMLIAIDPATHEVSIAPELRESEYASLEGRALRLPKHPGQRPSPEALQIHWMHVRSIRERQS
ncbi:hypothetical protein CBA19CS11_22850 [Caballeronia novacaledonica]|uniref:HNH endonuclease n=1 Tax=Caballeronia novacaledonica TaxID=1544861 RepID=UPI001EE3215C|nr:HNH endonuclease signature motif containing protein [Caballeronia novacaledonica]GJH11730.1 hypothetical protein CBA19CS11_22850 [Caballeronia novacaledonica]